MTPDTSTTAARSRPLSGRLIPWLFMAPALFFYIGFVVYPMGRSLVISLFEWDGLSPNMTFVGLENFRQLFFVDEVARVALVNNLLWTVGGVVVPTAIGLALAVALDRDMPGKVILRTIFYLPGVLPLIAVGLMWAWMYNPNFGVINSFLRSVGLGAYTAGWLSNFDTAFISVFITFLWGAVGFPMILYLAGLQGISREYYEAARVDGANGWHTFWHVTLPGLRETHIVVLSLALIGGFKVFDLVYTMTYGGPGRSTQVLGTWMYFQTFQYYNAGYGAAIAWVIAAIVMIVAIPYLRYQAKN